MPLAHFDVNGQVVERMEMTMQVLWRSMGSACRMVQWVGVCFMVVLLMVSGCNKGEKTIKDPEGAVREAAERYWTDRLVKKDVKAAYEMELEKDTISFEDYERRVANAGQIEYRSIRVDQVAIEGDAASVKLMVTYRVMGITKDMEAPIRDTWLIKGSEVKHVLEKEAKPLG